MSTLRTIFLLAVMLVAGYLVAVQPTVDAMTSNELLSILHNTPYYGNYGGDACADSSDSGSDDSSLTGSDNIEKAYNYFIAKGLNAVQAAAVVGNFQQESSLNPTIIQGGGNTKDPSNISVGWGIAQWTPGSKILGIAQNVKVSGPIYKLSTQLDIVLAEMKGTSPTGHPDVFGDIQKTGGLTEAVEFFRVNFEGGTMGNRQGYAQDILKRYGGNDTTGLNSAVSGENNETSDTNSLDDSGDAADNSADCNQGGGVNDDGSTATAGKGFVGNCLGKGSTAAANCGQCVAYVEWVLTHHADPKKGPYGVLTDQSGRGYHAAYTVTKNLGAKGYTVNRTPAVHSVFTIPSPPLTNGVGHTGIVSQVNTDASGNVTSIVVEESNWVSALTYGQRTLDAKYIKSHDMSFAHTEVGWHD